MPHSYLFIPCLALLLFLVMVVLHIIIRQLRSRVDIKKYVNGSQYHAAYLTHTEGKAAEAYLPDTRDRAVGRVSIEKTGEKAIVQLLQSVYDDDSSDPIYRRCGYLGEDGFIYSQPQPNGPVTKIGYVARPSNPGVPCLKGERSWKTLWLHAYLDVYHLNELADMPEPTPTPRTMVLSAPASVKEKKIIRKDQSAMTLQQIIEDIKSHMVPVEGGTFMMGAMPKDTGTVSEDGKMRGMVELNESPQHWVTIGDFSIGRFPVTQAEWKAIMGENPSDVQDDPNFPVSPVSMTQCKAFIEKLNALSGMTFSLPTEAQWEYAARGGKFSTGKTFSGSNSFAEVGWGDHKHPVGMKAPNELGLYDMSGLVREWCSDIWGHYSEEPQTDPVGPTADSPLVMKNPAGAICYVVRSPSGNETVTNRKGEAPELEKSFKSYGLRLAITPVKAAPAEAPAPAPTSAPATVPTVNSAADPVAVKTEKPDETSVEVPAVAPAEIVAEAPTEVPAEAPADVPVEAPAVAPVPAPVVSTVAADPVEAVDPSSVVKDDNPVAPAVPVAEVVQPEPPSLVGKATLVARCDKQGFSKPKIGFITTEARAGAYALFSFLEKRKDVDECYNSPKYGWKDTALLALLVYCVCYLVYYAVKTSILQRPLVGHFGLLIPVLYAFYFAIWFLVRSIKIEKAQSGNSFQPQLNMLNKTLGNRWADLAIIILSLIAIPLSISFFELDFIPLLLAIATGVFINLSVRGVSAPWRVKKSYSEREVKEPNEGMDDEPDTNQPPAGDLSNTYDWDLDYDGMSLHGNIMIRFDSDQIKEQRQNNPFFSQNAIFSMDIARKQFDLLCQRSCYMERTRFLARYIADMAVKADLAEHIKLQFALDFIQEPNIRFVRDKDSERIQFALQYMRLPDETLFDKEGDYDCKTFLAAMLFHAMGYDVLFMYSSKHDHYAIAVEERFRWTESIWKDVQNKHRINREEKWFVLCETTVDDFRVGELLEGITVDDFDACEYFPSNGSVGTDSDTEYRQFDWDYSGENGAAGVHGKADIGFNTNYISELRKRNPFYKGAGAGVPLIQNVASMVSLLTSHEKYTANLNLVALGVKERFPEMGLPGIQFVLDFVQEPNVRYCDDEKSATISFVKDYVRFPDETLYDKEGDNDCKALLAAMLLSVLGLDTLFLVSSKLDLPAIAVECSEEILGQLSDEDKEKVVISHHGNDYLFCELTKDGFRAGRISPDMSIADFDGILDIQKIVK